MDEANPLNYVSSAPYIDIPGGSFGSWGDGRSVTVTLYGTDAATTVSNACGSTGAGTSCQPTDRSLGTIRCVPTSRTNGTFPKLNLWASVSIGNDENTGCTRFAYVLPPPVLKDAIDTKIAQNADELDISGVSLWSGCRIELDVGTCEVTNFTETSIRCRLSLSAAAVGSSVRASVSIVDQFDSNAQVIVATIVAPPVVDSASTNLITPGSSRLGFSGSGFNSESPSRNFVRVRVDQRPYTNCTVDPSVSNSTFIVCDLSNSSALNFTTGTVYAIVRSYNGYSEERAIGSLAPVLPAPTAQQPDASSRVGSALNIPGIVGGVVGAFVAILIIVIVVFVVIIRRRRVTDVGHIDVPQEMASMFNIRSSDLEMKHKIGEGSFGAVYLCSYKGEDVALKKLTAAMISTHVNDFFREAATMTGIKPHKVCLPILPCIFD
jgi:hypothetical protein